MRSTIYIPILFLGIFISCEEPITIDTDQAPSQIIVEALLTNEMKQHHVKLTETADFYAVGETPRISDAMVTVTDNHGNIFDYHEEEPGVYLSTEAFSGVVGDVYSLSIIIGDETFTATEELLPITTIDSLTFEVFEDDDDDDIELRPGTTAYEVFLYTIEPQDEDNYYLFKFYRNGIWLNEDGEDITVTDDVAVGEEIECIEIPYIYFPGDTARVEMYSLTRQEFIFWSDVASLIFSDGGVFAPLPANPRSNISGGALGVFQVSALEVGELIIP